jgi:hypothetical protein
MRIVETKIYQFDELSATAKEVAIENHRDVNTYDGWWDPIFEGIREQGQTAGFDITDIYFSGFYSQGDGAMFEYETINDTLLNKFVDGLDLSPMRKSWLSTQTFARGRGKHRGQYYHEKCCDHTINFEPNFGWNEILSNWINSFEGQFEDFVIAEYEQLCSELYSRLSKYNDELTSDEDVADTIVMNEWEFDVDGNNFH